MENRRKQVSKRLRSIGLGLLISVIIVAMTAWFCLVQKNEHVRDSASVPVSATSTPTVGEDVQADAPSPGSSPSAVVQSPVPQKQSASFDPLSSILLPISMPA